MPTPELKIFGTFRSGTNLVRALLQTNFSVVVHNNTHAYKHLPIPADFADSVFKPFPLPVVGVVKDPLAFLDSLFRYCEKNNFRNVDGARDFDSFIRSRILIFDGGFKDFPRYRFCNPVQYWNSLNLNLLSIPKERCSVVRYEDVLQDMPGQIEKIADKFGLERKSEDFWLPPGTTKNLGDQTIEDPDEYITGEPFKRLSHYLDRQYLNRFDRGQLEFVLSELDMDVVESLSYTMDPALEAIGAKRPASTEELLLNDRAQIQKLEESQQNLLEKHEDTLRLLESEIADLQEVSDELREDKARQSLDLKRSEQALIELKTSLEEAEERIDKLESGIRFAEARGQQFEHANTTLQAKNLELEQKLVASSKYVRELQTKLAASDREVKRFEAAFRRASNNYYELKRSFSFRIGHDFVQAILKPGLGTVLFPYRTIRNLFEAIRSRRPSSPIEPPGPVTTDEAGSNASSARPTDSHPAKPDRPQSELTIACILDEFSTRSLAPECNLVPVPLHGWQKALGENMPDLLFVESAWKGSAGDWEFKVGKYANEDRSELEALTEWCRNRGIATVFWNKEDPVHFDKFIDAAGLFDVVFTTDANLVGQYRERLGHRRVYPLQFAAQPRIHNPIRRFERKPGICFAGSYYANRHEDRRRDMDEVLDIAREFGLVIYDRNFEKNQAGETTFSFPERFTENVVGSLPYSEIDKAYKGYEFLLNVNSVKDSPTMFSRRVFEGLACGTPVLSTYSVGIRKTFGNLVLISEQAESLRSVVRDLREDRLLYDRKAIEGMREVLEKHCYANRLQTILEKAEVATRAPGTMRVALLCFCTTAEDIAKALEIRRRQTWKATQLLILLEGSPQASELINRYSAEDVSVVHLPSAISLGTDILELVGAEFVAFLDLRNHYGANYLLDLVQASRYADADVFGKQSYFECSNHSIQLIEGTEYQYANRLGIDRSIVRSHLLHGRPLQEAAAIFDSERTVDQSFSQAVRGFSVNPYNFVRFAFLKDCNAASGQFSAVSV